MRPESACPQPRKSRVFGALAPSTTDRASPTARQKGGAMLRPSRVLAISSLLGLTLVGCEQPTADRPGPVHAQLAAPATPIFYDNHDAFFQQFHGLPLEDFEEGKVADAGILVCPAPVDASNNNQCFSPPDDILPGVEFNSDHSI